MLLWQLFSNVFNDVSNSIVANANLFSKVYFPKIIIPLSTILVCLVDFFISLIILVFLFVIAGQSIHWHLILAPVFILLTVINGLGLGLYFATINVKFRDVKFIVPVILQFGMYVTPVIFNTNYYLDRMPSWLHWLFCFNPMVWRYYYLNTLYLEATLFIISIIFLYQFVFLFYSYL